MFNRKKKSYRLLPTAGLFYRINSRIQNKQHQLADWMQKKTRHWKAKQQRCFLFILCLLMGGTSTDRLLELFDDRMDTSTPITKQQQLPLPVIPAESPAYSSPADTFIFSRFRNYLDSLLETPEGRKVYKDFLKKRPGFMDSLVFAEKTLKQSFPNH
ncbi:hypothetical protein LQ567_16650 [Niabella pedocola]|uniref:DUF4214 domain-containing protein n=1 Tax=Niabella pedocola TaxID=1752077 RepID=A0ABS8PVW7_9BACT|nr:hypothetical protein [Niabella pedocola]MCD2424412.1 hypothetical protein [Niabella pedocola]